MNHKLLTEMLRALAADLEDQGNSAGALMCISAADAIESQDRSIKYLLDAEKATPDNAGGL